MYSQEEKWLLEEGFGGVESDAFHTALTHLKAGVPLAYLIDHTPFLGCTIYLDSRPLIPRPETEFWVEKVIETIKNRDTSSSRSDLGPKVLDLCAGSGAIGVAIAKAIPGVQVTFAELDPVHLPTIKKNLIENTTLHSSDNSDKFSIVESDLFNGVPGRFDFIVSNPPYIDKSANTVEANVHDHEPHLALYGGAKGLEIIERILRAARASLAPHGELWLEHEPSQTKDIHALAKTHGYEITTYPDQYRTERYSIIKPTVAK